MNTKTDDQTWTESEFRALRQRRTIPDFQPGDEILYFKKEPDGEIEIARGIVQRALARDRYKVFFPFADRPVQSVSARSLQLEREAGPDARAIRVGNIIAVRIETDLLEPGIIRSFDGDHLYTVDLPNANLTGIIFPGDYITDDFELR